ncbi:MAG: FISUMP domain-containing protein, partial [Patescibacteria group bacterium]
SKKAFTLIELLVVIAIIGVLATVSVIALSNARSKSRDAKRVGNMKQVQTALELFFNDNGRYPTEQEWALGTLFSTTSDATTTYLQVIPTAPIPADGDCSENENELNYTPIDNGASYSISFCIGNTTGTIVPGNKTLTPSGIIAVGGGEEEEACVPNCTGICSGDDGCNGSCPDNCTGGDVCTNGTCQAPAFSCGSALIDTRDSESYATVSINGKCWMAENLNYDNGCGSETWSNYNDVGWCGYYNNNEVTYGDYGLLYQWSAAMDGTTAEGAQGVCPTGWHVPTDVELTALNDYLGTDAGGQLKEAGTDHWSGEECGSVSCNSSGFTGLPAGFRDNTDGGFYSNGLYANFWSSSDNGPTYAMWRDLYYGNSEFSSGTSPVAMGYSLRCLRNDQ